VITGHPAQENHAPEPAVGPMRHQMDDRPLANTHEGWRTHAWITLLWLDTKGIERSRLFHEFAMISGIRTGCRPARAPGPRRGPERRIGYAGGAAAVSNLNDDAAARCKFFFRSAALRELLRHPGWSNLRNELRSSMRSSLWPNRRHRIHRASRARRRRPKPLFSTLACRKVFALTAGSQLMNQLCDHALVYGYAGQAETITGISSSMPTCSDKNGFLPFRALPDTIEPSLSDLDIEAQEIASQASVEAEAPPRSPTRRLRRIPLPYTGKPLH